MRGKEKGRKERRRSNRMERRKGRLVDGWKRDREREGKRGEEIQGGIRVPRGVSQL